MKTTREFFPADRYVYDLGACNYAKGFAQIDTPQDAPYFGAWVNPTERKIVSYCEGDVTIQIAETDEELVAALRVLDNWNVEHQDGRALIDPGFNEDMKSKFISLGLADLLH